MDTILWIIEIGFLLGIGLYIGICGTEVLIDMISKGVKLILGKTLKTRKSDDERSND